MGNGPYALYLWNREWLPDRTPGGRRVGDSSRHLAGSRGAHGCGGGRGRGGTGHRHSDPRGTGGDRGIEPALSGGRRGLHDRQPDPPRRERSAGILARHLHHQGQYADHHPLPSSPGLSGLCQAGDEAADHRDDWLGRVDQPARGCCRPRRRPSRARRPDRGRNVDARPSEQGAPLPEPLPSCASRGGAT